jgi:hypothetical protein
MPDLFKDKEHLIRMAGLFAVGVAVFLAMRGLLVPSDFGALGHYRRGALDDGRAHQPAFAGRQACTECHEAQVKERTGSRHATVGCEACHGALAVHAADPTAATPARPDASRTCLLCHLANVAKPHAFPQVEPSEHGDGQPCSECHQPHHPEI